MPKAATQETEVITIKPLNMRILHVHIVGTAPYMQAAFSEKARNMMSDKMKEGSTARSKRTRTARDFDDDFRQAQHVSTDGWNGIPASAFRNACIDACRMAGYVMTHAKMSIFVEADGFDIVDATPLVRIIGGPPEKATMPVRNATGVADLRARPLWREWSAVVRIRFDADQFTTTDVLNLLNRAGQQVGVGEGRPFSKKSNGLGFGMFTVQSVEMLQETK